MYYVRSDRRMGINDVHIRSHLSLSPRLNISPHLLVCVYSDECFLFNEVVSPGISKKRYEVN